MNILSHHVRALTLTSLLGLTSAGLIAQPAGGPPGGGAGRGGGGFGGPTRQLVPQFDLNKNGRLNTAERRAAYEFLLANPNGRGGRGGRGGAAAVAQPGPKLTPADVKAVPAGVPLYDPSTLHTLFLEFDEPDWEKQMVAFNNTDVDVEANLRIDGKEYENIGVHFRGASSFNQGVSDGFKRSLNLSIDWDKAKQDVKGYNTLNLLNAHVDPSFLRTVLYQHIMREYIPAPKANFVRLVINHESWGIYINAQQFNKDFTKDYFKSSDGARWHVPGSPGGTAGLNYLGEDPAAYKNLYSIKSADDPKSWAALINLTKVLGQTPPDQLVAALTPILDIDAALKLLALENALVNNDGIWTRASDYNIYLDAKGMFHLIPHDANETLLRPLGGGRGGGAPITGVELSPLVAANDANKSIISKLLAVPALRTKYLGYVRDVADKWLDWNKLGPIAQKYHDLIADDAAKDTRKLYSTAAFEKSLTEDIGTGADGVGGTSVIGLKNFADQRRAYLLNFKAP